MKMFSKIIVCSILSSSFLFSSEFNSMVVKETVSFSLIEKTKQELFFNNDFSFNKEIPSLKKYSNNDSSINKELLKKDIESLILVAEIIYKKESSLKQNDFYKKYSDYIKTIDSVEINDCYAIVNNNIVLNYRFGQISLQINNTNIIDLYKNKIFDIENSVYSKDGFRTLKI